MRHTTYIKHYPKKGRVDRPPYIKVLHGMMDRTHMNAHAHHFSELVVVLSGTATYIENGVESSLEPGDILVVEGHTSHGYRDTRKLEISNIEFNPKVLSPYVEMLRTLPGYSALLPRSWGSTLASRAHLHLQPHDFGHVVTIIREMECECLAQRPGFEIMVPGLFLQLIVSLATGIDVSSGPETPPPDNRLMPSINYMKANLAEHITLANLASRTHMSITNFVRAFKQATGYAPISYLIRLRILQAGRLLRNSTKPVSEIAYDVGFSDSNYFSYQFRKITEESPSRYRQQHSLHSFRTSRPATEKKRGTFSIRTDSNEIKATH